MQEDNDSPPPEIKRERSSSSMLISSSSSDSSDSDCSSNETTSPGNRDSSHGLPPIQPRPKPTWATQQSTPGPSSIPSTNFRPTDPRASSHSTPRSARAPSRGGRTPSTSTFHFRLPPKVLPVPSMTDKGKSRPPIQSNVAPSSRPAPPISPLSSNAVAGPSRPVLQSSWMPPPRGEPSGSQSTQAPRPNSAPTPARSFPIGPSPSPSLKRNATSAGLPDRPQHRDRATSVSSNRSISIFNGAPGRGRGGVNAGGRGAGRGGRGRGRGSGQAPH
jgi:hypothetical protein